jgi:hypothetical protein
MARKWESIICYENRGEAFHTSRWRLSGIRTRQGAENTDGGVLWLDMSRTGDTVTADLYKDSARDASDKVATGSADVSGIDGGGQYAAKLNLTEANSSGVSGSFRIHRYLADGVCPVQVALCVDEDLDALWDGIESLGGYDATCGCAEFIRLATEDVLAKVSAMLQDQLGGYGAAEAWFITDASRIHPDLRRVANPAQLRVACAHRALELAVGRSHKMGADSMYSRLRDYHRSEYDRAVASLVLAIRPGDDGSAHTGGRGGAIRQSRV